MSSTCGYRTMCLYAPYILNYLLVWSMLAELCACMHHTCRTLCLYAACTQNYVLVCTIHAELCACMQHARMHTRCVHTVYNKKHSLVLIKELLHAAFCAIQCFKPLRWLLITRAYVCLAKRVDCENVVRMYRDLVWLLHMGAQLYFSASVWLCVAC